MHAFPPPDAPTRADIDTIKQGLADGEKVRSDEAMAWMRPNMRLKIFTRKIPGGPLTYSVCAERRTRGENGRLEYTQYINFIHRADADAFVRAAMNKPKTQPETTGDTYVKPHD